MYWQEKICEHFLSIYGVHKIVKCAKESSKHNGLGYTALHTQFDIFLKNWKLFVKHYSISYITCFVILNRYYTSLLFGLIVIFSILVFYLFGCSVINLVIWYSIYSVLWIRSNGLVQFIWVFQLNVKNKNHCFYHIQKQVKNEL